MVDHSPLYGIPTARRPKRNKRASPLTQVSQVRLKRISPSKVFGLYAVLEWGLKGLELIGPHSFSGVGKEGKQVSFFCIILEHEGYLVSIPSNTEDFTIVMIENKKGDNCVVMESASCSGKSLSLEEMVPLIKRKFKLDVI
jgi:hypothetical protein